MPIIAVIFFVIVCLAILLGLLYQSKKMLCEVDLKEKQQRNHHVNTSETKIYSSTKKYKLHPKIQQQQDQQKKD